MERKTKIHAEDNKHDLTITREFDLPLELLFKAYTEPKIVEQWMDNKVLLLENKKHGGYELQKSDANGNVVFQANGCIHEFIPNQKIVRTFEMTNGLFDVQLEFLEFEKRTETTSSLIMHVVYKSVALRDAMLKLPFAYGINMAHDRLEEIVGKLK